MWRAQNPSIERNFLHEWWWGAGGGGHGLTAKKKIWYYLKSSVKKCR